MHNNFDTPQKYATTKMCYHKIIQEDDQEIFLTLSVGNYS